MKQYKRTESMVSRRIADELILVPIKSDVAELNSIYSFNEIAASIWEFLDEDTTIETIVEMITKGYEVDAKQAEIDIREFLDQLEQIGAVTSTVVSNPEVS